LHDLVNLCQTSIQLQQAKEPLLDLPAFASASPNGAAIHYTADPCEYCLVYDTCCLMQTYTDIQFGAVNISTYVMLIPILL